MATFKICVFRHQKRQDDKYPVSIRICWKRQYSYIKTEYYVTERQINKKTFEIKDNFILSELNKRIVKFEDLKVKKLGLKIETYKAKELADWFINETKPGSDNSIDFIEFSRRHLNKLRAQGRLSSANNFNRVINSIIDFCNGRERIAISEITSKFLHQYEVYLRSERTMKRKNQLNKRVTITRAGLSDVSIIDYMTDIRTLFNAAVNEFNDDDRDQVKIFHYPFRKYKIKRPPEPEKRNLSVEQIREIRDVSDEKLELKRTIFARDIFLLSFYLCGMNLADLFYADTYKDSRIEYCRKKTKGRRIDKAFISIKVESEAAIIIDKYLDHSGERVFDFHLRYSDFRNFTSNVNKGLKKIAKICEIDEALSSYYARHSWATIARNKCGISKDDVDLALNHIDQGLKMADVYIEKDWTIIDKANKLVINYLHEI